jgi:hypothetical protein
MKRYTFGGYRFNSKSKKVIREKVDRIDIQEQYLTALCRIVECKFDTYKGLRYKNIDDKEDYVLYRMISNAYQHNPMIYVYYGYYPDKITDSDFFVIFIDYEIMRKNGFSDEDIEILKAHEFGHVNKMIETGKRSFDITLENEHYADMNITNIYGIDKAIEILEKLRDNFSGIVPEFDEEQYNEYYKMIVDRVELMKQKQL